MGGFADYRTDYTFDGEGEWGCCLMYCHSAARVERRQASVLTIMRLANNSANWLMSEQYRFELRCIDVVVVLGEIH